jgi:hypothetical protein
VAVKKEMTGLHTYLYTFGLKEGKKCEQYRARLGKTGMITTVFVDNRLAFEWRKRRTIYT